jgi:hypothetical protein
MLPNHTAIFQLPTPRTRSLYRLMALKRASRSCVHLAADKYIHDGASSNSGRSISG